MCVRTYVRSNATKMEALYSPLADIRVYVQYHIFGEIRELFILLMLCTYVCMYMWSRCVQYAREAKTSKENILSRLLPTTVYDVWCTQARTHTCTRMHARTRTHTHAHISCIRVHTNVPVIPQLNMAPRWIKSFDKQWSTTLLTLPWHPQPILVQTHCYLITRYSLYGKA